MLGIIAVLGILGALGILATLALLGEGAHYSIGECGYVFYYFHSFYTKARLVPLGRGV